MAISEKQKEAAIELLQVLLREEPETMPAAREPEPALEVPEMVSFGEARKRVKLSHQALMRILNDHPEAYIMNGRYYLVNFNNLVRVLNGGMTANKGRRET